MPSPLSAARERLELDRKSGKDIPTAKSKSDEAIFTQELINVRLNWNWSANGVVVGDVIDVKVFGIEMVYVPQGAFYAGDNATGDGGRLNRDLGTTTRGISPVKERSQ